MQNKFDYRNLEHEGNTGLFFVRSNERSIRLWKLFMEETHKYPRLDDQSIFWQIVRQTNAPLLSYTESCMLDFNETDLKLTTSGASTFKNVQNEFFACPLDACSFSSGSLHNRYGYAELMQIIKENNKTLFTAHANFVTGVLKKRASLAMHGFWILGPTGKCRDFKLLIPPQIPTGGVKITRAKSN